MLGRGRKAKERKEFETFLVPHLDRLYSTALRLTRNGRDAEDLLQDAILRAFRFFHQFERGSNAKAWFFKILTNTFINQYRRNKREQKGLEDLVGEVAACGLERLGGPSPQDGIDPEQLLLKKGISAEVQRAVESVPAPFRLAVLLADVEGFSYREIADILDCPVGTVMSRLYRGRGMLRVALVDSAARYGLLARSSEDAATPPDESNATAGPRKLHIVKTGP